MTVVAADPRINLPTGTSRGGAYPEGRHRRVGAVTDRVRRDGKSFRSGANKFYIKGVTYGPFAPDADGRHFASIEQTRRDFAQIRNLAANCIRIYYIPPAGF